MFNMLCKNGEVITMPTDKKQGEERADFYWNLARQRFQSNERRIKKATMLAVASAIAAGILWIVYLARWFLQ